MDDSIEVDYVEPLVLPHEPERVLDYHMLRTCHHVRKQALIKWKDCTKEGFTWENISVMWKCFPTFAFEDDFFSQRGELCQDYGPTEVKP